MSKLFIIGNGFDIAHNLPTSYDNFRQYLIDEYPDADQSGSAIPETYTGKDGEDLFANANDLVGFFLYVISNAESDGDNWCNIENSLGDLDFSSFLDDWGDYNGDDDNPWHEVYRNQDNASEIAKSILEITTYFSEWRDTIKIDNIEPLPKFRDLINAEKDFFLTFNYTMTLEELYDAKKVCHIHGKQDGQLLFGHGNNSSNYEYYMENWVGSEGALDSAHQLLMKDTSKAIENNECFFYSLSSPSEDIKEIYSYGFSFSDVDMVYIRKICSQLSTRNITWYLSGFNKEEERNEFKEKIRAEGFEGNFDVFSIVS